MSDYSTKRELAPDYEVVKVTWWNGQQWYTTLQVQRKPERTNGPVGPLAESSEGL